MILILINNVKEFKIKFLYILIIFKNLIISINFLTIIKRVIYLYVINVNNQNAIKMLLLKILNNFSFTKMLIYNYFYFELDIDKSDDVFLKTKMILRKFKISFSLRIARVF